jgi:hypothetical protein
VKQEKDDEPTGTKKEEIVTISDKQRHWKIERERRPGKQSKLKGNTISKNERRNSSIRKERGKT